MATPLMGLDLPSVGITLGPLWASQINLAFDRIDSHDHTPGFGSLIPSAGLNINSDLSFGSNNQTAIKSSRFTSLGSSLSGSLDKECIYSVNGSLYYNNSAGTAVQITSGTGLNLASVGSIGGDYGGAGVTASVTYSNLAKTYNFLQAPSATAKIAVGDVLIYETNTSLQAVTLKSPASLVAGYNVTFPAALPASTNFLRMTNAGLLQNDLATDNTTIEVSGSSLRIKDAAITNAKKGAPNFATAQVTFQSTNSGTPVNFITASITTLGRPVEISLVSIAGANSQLSMATTTTISNPQASLEFYDNTTASSIALYTFEVSDGDSGVTSGVGARARMPPSFLRTVFFPAAGTYSISFRVSTGNTNTSITLINTLLLLREL